MVAINKMFVRFCTKKAVIMRFVYKRKRLEFG